MIIKILLISISVLLHFCQQFFDLRAEDGFRAQLGQRRRISDQIVKHKALGGELFGGAYLLTLRFLLAFGVVLGARLLSLLLISEQPQVLSQLSGRVILDS